MPVLVKRTSGSSTRLPTMVVWLSVAICSAPCSCCWWLAFVAEAFGSSAGAGGLVAGVVDGVGYAVVLAGLPDDRIGVVLAAVVEDHPRPEGEGSLPLLDVTVTNAAGAVGGDAEGGVEPVEGPLGLDLPQPV